MTRPKAVLFDIGGVCVVSPFQAIVDYEAQYKIPKDYINFAISRSAPNGAWQRLERGEIKMDEAFFASFQQDLNNPMLWEQYHLYFKNRGHSKSLKEMAAANATRLGDPVSLKAETSSTNPTPEEAGAPMLDRPKRRSFKDVANKAMLGDPVSLKAEKSDKSPMPDDSGAPPDQQDARTSKNPSQEKSLKETAAAQLTQLGDPVSLKAETSSTNPTPEEAGASTPARPKRRSFKDVANKAMLGDPVSLKAEKSDKSPMPDDSGAPPERQDPRMADSKPSSLDIPPIPKIDSTKLFWNMMARIREPDPNVFPALLALRESKQFLVAALSNTVVFPADHELSKGGSRDIQSYFDVFISSSEIGLRKPDPKIYQLAIEKLDSFDRGKGGDGVHADQVIFLDDIGENLKPARDLGIQTIKVNLGRTNEAVEQLERVVGMKLSGGQKSRL